jgi:ssRNA-specific RNase YbeY (16S rRNA maturation enzyme)
MTAGPFDWIKEPVLNPYTRLAVAMCPARGILHVAGYDHSGEELLPERVTQTCEIIAAAA